MTSCIIRLAGTFVKHINYKHYDSKSLFEL